MLSRLLSVVGRGRGDGRSDPWRLDMPLLRWSRGGPEWDIRASVENTLIFGATGAGKTSGSGRAIALSLLRAGYGGCVLCAKGDEVGLWESYCAEAGRSEDLIIVRPGGPWRFDPLAFEALRANAAGGLTENLVNLFDTILELADRNGGSGGARDDEAYWRRSTKQLVRNCIDLLVLAGEHVAIEGLYQLVISAPQSLEEVRSDDWRRSSYCFRLLKEAERRPKSADRERDFGLAADYFLREFPALSSKTRSVVVSCFTSQIDVMQRGVLRELFGADTTFTPDASEHGRIIVVGLPVKEYREVGLIANVLIKYCWQRAIESRDLSENARPVFLWCDEFQTFATSQDAQFFATCRSARAATVLLSQNVSGVHAALGGGDNGRAEADAIFANCNTKLFHANLDTVTNTWAADLIGKRRDLFMSVSQSEHSGGGLASLIGLAANGQASAGASEQLDHEVPPSAFARLRTGGPANGWNVDAILVQSGKRFRESGGIWMPVTFKQARR